MSTRASEIIKLAQSWLGKNEADGSHKDIIDIYNAHEPLARGYKVKYTDAWCATTISALAIKCGATDIIPTECGCGEMIALFKQLGVWVETENRVPNVGDIIFYDWNNDGWSDHVGIVEKVEGSLVTIIEGNYKNAVSYRTIGVNARNIRGYAVPKYDPEEVSFIHEGLDYAVLFDPTYYSDRYADLKKAFGTDSTKLFAHFIKYGMKEGRQACATFNVHYYMSEYKDLQTAFGSNLPAYYQHYIKYGKKEGRRTVQRYGIHVGLFIDRTVAEIVTEELIKLGYVDAKLYRE